MKYLDTVIETLGKRIDDLSSDVSITRMMREDAEKERDGLRKEVEELKKAQAEMMDHISKDVAVIDDLRKEIERLKGEDA